MGVELPEGWSHVQLSDVCEINPPKPSADALPSDALVTFVPMPAVEAEQGAISNPVTRAFAEVRKGFTSFRNEDVIMAKITPCMENGKAAIARRLQNGIGFGSTEFHVLRSNGSILPEYVYFYIRQEAFRRAAEAEMTGSVGQKRVPASFLVQAGIPLPSLAEQKRIVAKVEALLARVNAARERLDRVPATLKRFRQAVLSAACSGRLTANGASADEELPSGWTTVSLSALVHTLHQGWSPKCEIYPSPSPAIWGVIKTTAVQALSFIEGENKRLPEHLSPRENLELREGDLLITRAGPRVRAGVCCLVRAVRPRLMICDKVYRFRARQALVLPDFVELALNAPATVELIDTLKTGISDSGVNLTQEKFLALEISLPPLAEQQEIIRRVYALFALADAIERRVEAVTQRAEKLTQAILAKAFRGELVPTEAELARQEGRDYEPASALLERIRAERNGASPPPKKAVRRRRK